VRFTKCWKFVGSAILEPIGQIVPRADQSEGERLLGEPRRAGGRRLQQILRAVILTARSAPRLQSLSHITVNVIHFALFKEDQVGVAQLHLHGNDFFCFFDERIAAVYEFKRAALHYVKFRLSCLGATQVCHKR
jgi:hypothetical protein